MVKHKLFWHSPVIGAVVFVLMTCAVLAGEVAPDEKLSQVYMPKLYKSWNSVYLYDCWRNPRNTMAAISNKRVEPAYQFDECAVFIDSPAPSRHKRSTGCYGLRSLSQNNLCSTS